MGQSFKLMSLWGPYIVKLPQQMYNRGVGEILRWAGQPWDGWVWARERELFPMSTGFLGDLESQTGEF